MTDDKIVRANSGKNSFLNENLLNNNFIHEQQFSNFAENKMIGEKYPKSFTNDDDSRTLWPAPLNPSPRYSWGLPNIRFGWGLLAPKQLMPTNYADDNFMSIKHQLSHENPQFYSDGWNAYDSYNWYQQNKDQFKDKTKVPTPQQIINNNNNPGDIYAKNTINPPTSQGHPYFTHDFQGAKTTRTSRIIGANDFDLTPDQMYNPKTKNFQTSQEKQTFMKLFNEELYDWYWDTSGGAPGAKDESWGSQYDDHSVSEGNAANAEYQEGQLSSSPLTDAITLNLNLSWNQLITEPSHQDIPWYDKLPWDLSLTAILGSVSNGSSDGYRKTISKDINQLYDYYSPELSEAFWLNFFDQYLGIPTAKPGDKDYGLINQYYDNHQKIPSSVTMKDFDFYVPFKSINIQSKFYSRQTNDVLGYTGNAPDHYSTSTIDLSKLENN